MANPGKVFEADLKASIPDGVLIYRLPDPAAAFGGSGNLRFSKKNPFDFIIWNPERMYLYALELKSVSGKSVSFERTKEDNGIIHKHQIDGLTEWSQYDRVVAGFIIEFRNEETTMFLNIDTFHELEKVIDKKSFHRGDLDAHGLPYAIIPQKKLRVHNRYDMEKFLEEVPDFNTTNFKEEL